MSRQPIVPVLHNLFVYGTLTFPEIVTALTGKNFRSAPAMLSGFSVRAIKDKDYPALVKQTNSVAEGRLLLRLN